MISTNNIMLPPCLHIYTYIYILFELRCNKANAKFVVHKLQSLDCFKLKVWVTYVCCCDISICFGLVRGHSLRARVTIMVRTCPVEKHCFTTLCLSNLIPNPALDCKNGPSGLDGRQDLDVIAQTCLTSVSWFCKFV